MLCSRPADAFSPAMAKVHLTCVCVIKVNYVDPKTAPYADTDLCYPDRCMSCPCRDQDGKHLLITKTEARQVCVDPLQCHSPLNGEIIACSQQYQYKTYQVTLQRKIEGPISTMAENIWWLESDISLLTLSHLECQMINET